MFQKEFISDLKFLISVFEKKTHIILAFFVALASVNHMDKIN